VPVAIWTKGSGGDAPIIILAAASRALSVSVAILRPPLFHLNVS